MNTVNYRIYQLSDLNDELQSKIAFKDFSLINKYFDFKYYQNTYQDTISVDSEEYTEILDIIFTKLNVEPPRFYYGLSLYVSDIIELDGRFWYCNYVGWQEVTNLCKEK